MIEISVPDGARLSHRPKDHATLADIKPGGRAVVCCVRGREGPRQHLLEMGFVSGTPVRVVRLAPFGDPMQVELHGYHISLRQSEAREILVRSA